MSRIFMYRKIWTTGFTTGILLFIVAIAAQIAQFYNDDYTLNRVAYGSLTLACLWAINYLYCYGSFSRSRWKNTVYLFTSAFFIASLLHIQHWVGGNYVLLCTWAAIAVAYTIWFGLKEEKDLIDVLKAVWVVSFCTLTLLRSFKLFDGRIYSLVYTTGLLYFIYIKFHIDRVTAPVKQEEDWDFDKERPTS